MSRDTVQQAFDTILPAMGFTVRRDAQYQYAMMVQDKLNLGEQIAASETDDPRGARPAFGAIEAGTGTGKTLGYLIPVLLHIAETGGRARITTHTLALQDQIYGRRSLYADQQPNFTKGDRSDMAIALEVVKRLTGKVLATGFRKGRQAYVSPVAVQEIVDAEKKDKVKRVGADLKLFRDLQKWAKKVQDFQDRQDALATKAKDDTESKDSSDALSRDMAADSMQGLISAFMDAHDGRLPNGILASDIGMVPTVQDNPFHRRHAGASDECDVLVISHALALFDLQRGRNLLPPTKVIVHDEADTLAGVAEMYARKKIRPGILRHILRKAYPKCDTEAVHFDLDKARHEGNPLLPFLHLDSLLTEILGWFHAEYQKANPVDDQGLPVLESPVSEVMLDDKTILTTSALEYIRMLTAALENVMDSPVLKNATDMQEMRFLAVAQQMHAALRAAHQAFPANSEFGARHLSLGLDGLPKDPRESAHLALGVSWTPIRQFPSFEVVNLYASRMFSKEWFFKSEELKTVILTSATLRTPAAARGKTTEWDYMTRLLGMPAGSGRHVVVKQFGQIARIHAITEGAKPFLKTSDNAEPQYDPEWIAGAQAMLLDMLATGERGLVLAASFRDVYAVMENFADPRIWWQTDSQSMHWREGAESLRLGEHQIMVTPSVWAGANIRDANGGQLIRHLGFFRAPIAAEDPVEEKALANFLRWKGLDHAEETAKVTLQNIAGHAGKHRMTQGLGRGIRSASDIIEVWLMDPRLCRTDWQATFPERFRGLFADPSVFRPIRRSTSTASGAVRPFPKGSSTSAILKHLKSPLPGKPKKKQDKNQQDKRKRAS
ncbi:hypothetical protein DLNHIDIE_00104 [Acidithiobacillus thiooxidans ATCC 19377]|uniref:Helicase ATP-binding domain-containing protein n=2 Tax=Acidithiobacillus thiooxidans TaxID=930 RepID=A0A543Q1Q1_ACITH|nr:hypothetical protein DLNHIDIE_00104 [Acidithiobacillus thiooxidans ATCC 19377]